MDSTVQRVYETLTQDMHSIYHRCGAEVERVNKHSELKPILAEALLATAQDG